MHSSLDLSPAKNFLKSESVPFSVYGVELGRLERRRDVEVGQRLHPVLNGLQLVHHDSTRREFPRASFIFHSGVIVHPRLRSMPVLRLLPVIEPSSHHHIFRPLQILQWDLGARNPLHQVPRECVPHPGHVSDVRVHVGAGGDVAEVEIAPAERRQLRHQFRYADVSVVVGLEHVVVAGGKDGRERGEVGVGLPGVHVLGAVEDDDVAEAENLERDHEFPLIGGQAAEDEADVDGGAGNGRLDAVDEPQEMAFIVLRWEGEDADEYPELAGRLRRQK